MLLTVLPSFRNTLWTSNSKFTDKACVCPVRCCFISSAVAKYVNTTYVCCVLAHAEVSEVTEESFIAHKETLLLAYHKTMDGLRDYQSSTLPYKYVVELARWVNVEYIHAVLFVHALHTKWALQLLTLLCVQRAGYWHGILFLFLENYYWKEHYRTSHSWNCMSQYTLLCVMMWFLLLTWGSNR